VGVGAVMAHGRNLAVKEEEEEEPVDVELL
jgi:hypothetical protein